LKNINIVKDFKENINYCIYKNFFGLKLSKEFTFIKNQKKYQINDELNKFYFYRKKSFINSCKKYGITYQNNGENTYNININEENRANDIDINQNNEEFKFELLASILIFKLLKESEINEKLNNPEENKQVYIKFELPNFNLSEESLISVISGIKFNNNLTEINLSGNLFSLRSSYWLGTIFKVNPNIKYLDLMRCNLDNDCLYLFLEGAKYDNEKLDELQYDLEKLNLKDNPKITDSFNNESQNALCQILKKFKLKSLNLTNTKLGNSGVTKFFKTFIDLAKQNKICLENLIRINNDIKNEECLDYIGKALELPNCTLRNLILNKNAITTPCQEGDASNFANFMKSIGKSKCLKTLYFIECGIGKNSKDIDKLCEMLCENKSLESIRLNNNNINDMEAFKRILGIFSEHGNNLRNNIIKTLDISNNHCNIKIDEDFLDLIEKLKLEYLDLEQNIMDPEEKLIFKERTDNLSDIRITY
jgi:hypothetical protein